LLAFINATVSPIQMHHLDPACSAKIHGTQTFHKVNSTALGNSKIDCCIDAHGHQLIECTIKERQSTHYALKSLLEEVPSLKKEENLLELAKLVNFLYKGMQFQVIENPEEYAKQYMEEYAQECEMFEPPSNALCRYGKFNVDEIKKPITDNHSLIFYVACRIPYRVTCLYPDQGETSIKYELLPYTK
jgi:hypothetical protein